MIHIQCESRHASHERLQQRGIPGELVSLVSRFGKYHHNKNAPGHAHDSCISMYFAQASIKKMSEAGVPAALIQLAEKKRDLRFVVSKDGTLVTAYYANAMRRRVPN